MRSYDTHQGFTVLEAVVSVLLVMLFVLSVVLFFSLQNRSIKALLTESATNDIANEAVEYIDTMGYSQLAPGTSYVLGRKIIAGSAGQGDSSTYELNPIGSWSDLNAYADGEYLTSNAFVLSPADMTRMKDGYFRRIIDVRELVDPFMLQKERIVTIKIWSDACDFNDLNHPCYSKTLLVSDDETYE